MKYSIRGNMNLSDGSDIVDILNNYSLWRLITNQSKGLFEDKDIFNFEVWVNTEAEKDNLFNELKPFVDQFGENIDWHECTHDEEVPQPCVIAEEYKMEEVI